MSKIEEEPTDDKPVDKKQSDKWREQVAATRYELFKNLKFDKFGRLIKVFDDEY